MHEKQHSEIHTKLEHMLVAAQKIAENLSDRPLTDHKHRIWYVVSAVEHAVMNFRHSQMQDTMMEQTAQFEEYDEKTPRTTEQYAKLLATMIEQLIAVLNEETAITLEVLWHLKSKANALLRATAPKRNKLSKSFAPPFP